MDKSIESRIAQIQHDQWSGWMRYLFEKSKANADGTVTMPLWAVERWKRQMNTPYADLTDREQESDRIEARKLAALMREYAAEQVERIEVDIHPSELRELQALYEKKSEILAGLRGETRNEGE